MTSASTVARRGFGSGGRPRPGAGSRRNARRLNLAGWLFSLPFVLLFLVFMAWPLLASLAMSFTDLRQRDLRTPFNVDFVGIENYANLLANSQFVSALLQTGYFIVVALPLTLLVALVLAVALDRGIRRFKTVFRVIFYAPVVTSAVAIAIVWRYIFADQGLVNGILSWIDVHGPDWLNSVPLAMPIVIVFASWRNVGLAMVIFLAGLQAIPKELHDAAQVDGATPWRRFRSITLPLLTPAVLLAGVLLSIAYIQVFEEPFVLTQGGPLQSTVSATYFTYQQFGFGNYGVATAACYVLMIVILLLALLQFRLNRRRD